MAFHDEIRVLSTIVDGAGNLKFWKTQPGITGAQPPVVKKPALKL